MRKRILTVIALVLAVFFIAAYFALIRPARFVIKTSEAIVNDTWAGYKRYFIDESGRVKRPKERDTVSEGQAYAMLRAVWMGDREVFDRCYRWTEDNLSRRNAEGDNLLAWHWKDGKVADRMPASDADIDYALSLVLADARWKSPSPRGAEDYGQKAKKILSDILRFETYRTDRGRLYLAPWILNSEGAERFPVNPSYYSPAHFRVFYRFSGDSRWLSLADTAYYVLESLSLGFDGEKGVGLIPDWCSVDGDDRFYALEGKNPGFGWEAVRIPFRIAMDYYWFDSKQAEEFLKGGFSGFLEKEWRRRGAIFCEYSYSGASRNKYENPLFYASYSLAFLVSGSGKFRPLLAMSRGYIKDYDGSRVYQNPEEYYVNSLAWFTEGIISKTIRFD